MLMKYALIALLVGATCPVLANEVKIGDLTIQDAWSRATPKGAPVGVGYLTIRNDGATDDRLTGGSAEIGAVQLHDTSHVNGVMKMREVAGGVVVPAHGAVTLAPNGYHLMFDGLKQPLVKGQPFKATLTFEHAGAVEIGFEVRAIGAGAKPGAMGDMKM